MQRLNLLHQHLNDVPCVCKYVVNLNFNHHQKYVIVLFIRPKVGLF